MENSRIYELLLISDAASRLKYYSMLSTEEKLDFGRKIVLEVLKGRAKCGQPIMTNMIKDTMNDIKRIFVTNIDGLTQTTKLLRSKVFDLQTIVQSDECKFAFEILTGQDYSEEYVKKAEDLILALIAAIDYKNLEIGEKILDQILRLPLESSAKIFTALVQKFINKLHTRDHKSRCLIPILLELSKNPKTARNILNFWTSLADMKLNAEWKEVFETLTMNLAQCLKLQMSSMESESEDDQSKYQSDILKLVSKLSKHVDANNAFEYFSWILYEPKMSDVDREIAFLFLEEFSPYVSDFNSVNKVIGSILELPQNSQYLHQSIKLLTRLSNWLKYHPERIQAVLEFLMKALSLKESIADAAAEAFKEISRDCRKHVIDYADTFFQIFLNFNIFNMSHDGQEDFIKALCAIVSCFSEDKLVNAMTEICRVQFDRILSSPNPKDHLDHLSEIFIQIEPHGSKKPTAKVFMEFWPRLSNMMDQAASCNEVLRRIIESIKCAVVTNGRELMPIFEEMIEKTLQHLNEETCEKALSLFTEIFKSLDANFFTGLMTLFETAALATFSILRSTQSFSSSIVEKFFKFAIEVFLKCPVHLMQSPIIIPTIELAIDVCCMDIRDSKALKFLEIILTSESTSIASYQREIMSKFADKIVYVLLRSSMFIFTDVGALTSVAKIFEQIKKASYECFSLLISNSVDFLPNRKSNGELTVSIQNLKDFLQSITRPETASADIKKYLITLRKMFNAT